MPAPRVPTSRLELRGAFKKDPKRKARRAKEPRALPALGEPPDKLPEKVLEAWHGVVERCPKGVLTTADVYIVELTSRLVARMRAGELNGFLAQQLRGCLASLGMTPADRSRVSTVETEKPKSGWDDIAGPTAPN